MSGSDNISCVALPKLERRVTVAPCYGTRGSREDGGNHGAEAHFSLSGPLGALSLQIMTGWHLNPGEPHEDEGLRLRPVHSPQPLFVIHSAKERDYFSKQDACEFLGGAPCWCDTGSFAGDHFLAILVKGGSEALWAAFEKRYAEEFQP